MNDPKVISKAFEPLFKATNQVRENCLAIGINQPEFVKYLIGWLCSGLPHLTQTEDPKLQEEIDATVFSWLLESYTKAYEDTTARGPMQ